jgi:hypothetical protein
MRFRKNDPEHNLLAATQHFILSRGGKLVMVGGIEIQQWPADTPYSFRVGVRCMGRSGPATTET